MCVLIFCTNFVWNISHSKENSVRWDTKNVYWSLREMTVIIFRFSWKLHFLDGFSKNPYLWNFMKLHPVSAQLSYDEGQTDRHDQANLSNWPTWCTNASFIISLLYSSTCFEHCCAHHQEVKTVLYSIWYHHTETSPWPLTGFSVMTPDAV